MTKTGLIRQIAQLPDSLAEQVSDYVSYLMMKHGVVLTDDPDLDASQITELLHIWEEYLANPDDVMTMEELDIQMKNTHGLSIAG